MRYNGCRPKYDKGLPIRIAPTAAVAIVEVEANLQCSTAPSAPLALPIFGAVEASSRHDMRRRRQQQRRSTAAAAASVGLLNCERRIGMTCVVGVRNGVAARGCASRSVYGAPHGRYVDCFMVGRSASRLVLAIVLDGYVEGFKVSMWSGSRSVGGVWREQSAWREQLKQSA